MLEETPQTIGQKIWRGLIGLFLGILVLMLIITLLPGDMEESFMNQITGQMRTTAGEVGKRSIPMDYFNAARRDCYYRYKDYAPQMAANDDMITNCGYQTLRTIFIGKDIADSFGYQVSELAVKRDLSRQAREYHKQASDQAGYDEQDLRSAEEIYKNLLRSEPILYRLETATTMSLFSGFLRTNLMKTPSELALEQEALSTKVSIRLVPFTDAQLAEIIEKDISISDADLQAEYDRETKAGNTPKGEDGKPLPFEARKAILTSKMRLERKNKGLEEKLADLKKLREAGTSLDDLAGKVSSQAQTFSNLSIQDLAGLSIGGQIYRLSQDQSFLKDMSELGFGSKLVGGPYKDGEKNFFVEFSDLKLPTTAIAATDPAPVDRNFLAGFFMEMSQSYGKDKPLVRYGKGAGE